VNILDLIAGPIFSIIDKIIPDPQAKAAAQLEVLKLNQAGEFKQLDADLQLALAQIKVNEIEAGSADNFRGGWRPAVGWICAFGLATQFILRPLLPWAVEALGGTVAPIPPLDMSELFGLLFGMLGLGAYRTVERLKGKA